MYFIKKNIFSLRVSPALTCFGLGRPVEILLWKPVNFCGLSRLKYLGTTAIFSKVKTDRQNPYLSEKHENVSTQLKFKDLEAGAFLNVAHLVFMPVKVS